MKKKMLFWGILIAGVIVFAFVIGLKLAGPAPSNTKRDEIVPKPVSITDVDISELYKLTNEDRAKSGLPSLRLSSAVQQSASDKCNDMVTKNYYDHISPDGLKPEDFLAKYTQYASSGENIAAYFHDASAKTVNDDWMASEGHRANILQARFTDVSFAVCLDPNYQNQNTLFVVEQFIQTASPPPGGHGALCVDGSSSDSVGPGTCSWHEGVDHYLYLFTGGSGIIRKTSST